MDDQTQPSGGAIRTAILPAEGVRVVRRGPIQIRFVAPAEPFDAGQALAELKSLGFDVEGLSPAALGRLTKAAPELVRRMVYEDVSPDDVGRTPEAFRELLGDELVAWAQQLGRQARAMRSGLNPPDLGADVRRGRRRKDDFAFQAVDSQFEQAKRALLQKVLEWATRDPANLDALQAHPDEVIERLGADQHPAVRRALLGTTAHQEAPDA
jgi:hypothetical protein